MRRWDQPTLSLKVLTRIGTNRPCAVCEGRNNAVRIRLYFDSRDRLSQAKLRFQKSLGELCAFERNLPYTSELFSQRRKIRQGSSHGRAVTTLFRADIDVLVFRGAAFSTF